MWKLATVTLALAALATGLMAACKWYAASKVQPYPNWRIEPVEPTLAQMGWTSATLEAFEKAGHLNARAALWTAASVILGALSGISGAISN
jgi:hypothetical protein